MSEKRATLLVLFFLAFTTLLAYSQVRHHAFVNIDDTLYVTKNPQVQGGLTPEGIKWALTTRHSANWHPLTWLSHMLDCSLFGLDSGAHHLVSLAFHIANSLLLFLLLKRMTGGLWPSAFVACLFALHPLHVESVAWASERKDVLSTLFWFLTTWAYVSYARDPNWRRYLAAILLFALGLMAKPMLVTLPFVLMLLDFWPLARFPIAASGDSREGTDGSPPLHLFREKLPFLALAALSSLMTLAAQKAGGAVAPLDGLPFHSRLANASVSYSVYIKKMFWPEGLAVFYPYDEGLPAWQVVASGLVLVCVTVLIFRAARRIPPIVTGWLWYLGTLVPVIGVVQVGNQALADRYTYVPLIGLFIMVAWGVEALVRRWPNRGILLTVAASAVLAACTITTSRQVAFWRDSRSLYERALAVTENNSLAHYNLGLFLAQQGELGQAVIHYGEVVRIKPDFQDAHYNLARTLYRQDKLEDAILSYSEALRIQPQDAEAHNGLGNSLFRLDRFDEASAHYREALRIEPDYPEAHNNLAALLVRTGNFEEAVAHYHEALRLRPDYARARANLDRLLERTGKPGYDLEDQASETREKARARE